MEQVVAVADLFYEPVDKTNNQAKQHETPEIDKCIGNRLWLAFAVTKHPINAHNYEPNAKSCCKDFKKQFRLFPSEVDKIGEQIVITFSNLTAANVVFGHK